MDWNIWGPPLAVLGLSTVIGFFVIRGMKEEEPVDERAELLARKAQLLESIRELEADQSKMDAESYDVERERLLAAAGKILRELEEGNTSTESSIRQTTSSVPLGLQVLATLGFFLLVASLIGKYSAPRQEGEVMTGGSVSEGNTAESMAVKWAQMREERVAKAQAVLEKNPTDLSALNILTYDALLVRDMNAAMKYMEQVRNQNPEDPDFMVHLAVLQMTVGMYERAEIGLSKALEVQPAMPKALLWKGYLLAGQQKPTEAKAVLEQITEELPWPEEQYFLSSLIADLDTPPAMITGSVLLPEGDVASGTLFVIAARSPNGGGPPVAVRKIQNPVFPLSFELGKGDMIMGGQWPEKVYLSARVDQDGNAMTKDDISWKNAEAIELSSGKAEGIEIKLLRQ